MQAELRPFARLSRFSEKFGQTFSVTLFEPRWACPRCCGEMAAGGVAAATGGEGRGASGPAEGCVDGGGETPGGGEGSSEGREGCGSDGDGTGCREPPLAAVCASPATPAIHVALAAFPLGRYLPFGCKDTDVAPSRPSSGSGSEAITLPPCHWCLLCGHDACSMEEHGEQQHQRWEKTGVAAPEGWEAGESTRGTDISSYKVRWSPRLRCRRGSR